MPDEQYTEDTYQGEVSDFSEENTLDFDHWSRERMRMHQDFPINRWIHLFQVIFYIWEMSIENIPDIELELPQTIEKFLSRMISFPYENENHPYRYKLRELKEVICRLYHSQDIELIKQRIQDISHLLQRYPNFNPDFYENSTRSMLTTAFKDLGNDWDKDDYFSYGEADWFLLEYHYNFFDLSHDLGDDCGRVVRKLRGTR